MEWIADPTAWLGLATLIVLEIVLGIDNLVFIAILTGKLPRPRQRPARITGLLLALVLRLGLLASISWIVGFTAPLLTVGGLDLSLRDLILTAGGAFLLFKATTELHERLEGEMRPAGTHVAGAAFWQVIVQIVALDAVFSLDSILTAVGIAEHLPVMMIAVIVAVGLMILAAQPLMDFVNARPTVVILCLGFLLMIGFSLVLEGVGFDVPKGYLYAAIGFSILIEAFNQTARRNRARALRTANPRDRTAEAVLWLLGGPRPYALMPADLAALTTSSPERPAFAPTERAMIRRVLDLRGLTVRSIMTPRADVDWLDLDLPAAALRQRVLRSIHDVLPVARGGADDLIGVAHAKDIVHDLAERGSVDVGRSVRPPILVDGDANALDLIERFRGTAAPMAIVVDGSGRVDGVATPVDILRAVAGEREPGAGPAPTG